MAQVSRSALLMYSAQEMYQLVDDVDAYPEFLPGCSETQVLVDEPNLMRASIKVSKAGIGQTFVTENTLISGQSIGANAAGAWIGKSQKNRLSPRGHFNGVGQPPGAAFLLESRLPCGRLDGSVPQDTLRH